MPDPKKQDDPSQNGTEDPARGASGDSEDMSQDWLSRLREADSGWNEPAFPERFADDPGRSARNPRTAGRRRRAFAAGEPARWSSAKIGLLLLIGAVAIGWTALVLASSTNNELALRWAATINLLAVLSGPLLLLGGLAALVVPRRMPAAPAAFDPEAAEQIASQAAHATARLGDAHAQLAAQTREFATVSDQSAHAMLGTVQAMATQTGLLEERITASTGTLGALAEQISTMADALPRLEDRLATLGETLARVGGDLGQRHDALDEQLQATALIAEEARVQLLDAGKLIGDQLSGLRSGARDASDELSNLSELSSARLDLTIDRVKTVLDATERRIEAHNGALAALVERSRAGIEGTADGTLERFAEHCRKIETILDALDTRIAGQAERSGGWLEDTARGVTALAGEFNTLEQSAVMRTERLSATMMQLSGDTRRLIEAVETGHGSSDQLIKRAEALLVALDSGVRELDESMPAAIGRVEAQLGAMHDRIRSASPAIEAVEAVAAGVVSQLHESDQLAKAHVAALTEALRKSQGALASQKEQVAGLAATIQETSAGMEQLGRSAGPQMVEALVRVRETADAAAARAREAMLAIIPDAASQLGQASAAAVEDAVARSVSEQLGRLSLVADDAVKAAHRATDKLTRQMLSLTDASKELERTLAANAERIETQDRELMAHHSAKLIASLNERAIDVNKWLDKDVHEADWTAYLKGDQGLFARRATRLVSGAEAKHVHALYHDDPDFREHVNRYVHDFEALLRTVMATRDGSTLALTMVSSDIGKLYVALAQAIERLRAH
jgi:septal ring factor EnvC (AmiA/AmiB activator)